MLQSAHTVSWSDNPGKVCIDLLRPGLFVQNKSRIFNSRDGDVLLLLQVKEI